MKRILRAAVLIAGVSLIAFLLARPGIVSGDDFKEVLAARARTVLDQRCFRCHGLNNVAKKNVFVLDRERLVTAGVVVPGDAGSRLLTAVESGAMPMGGPELSIEEKAILRTWVVSGAPGWNDQTASPRREYLTSAAITRLMLDDLGRVPDRSRQFIRYFTLAHLYNAGVSDEELSGTRSALSKLINSLSWHPQLTPPAAIDPASTVLRIDLRDYNWSASTWNAVVALYPYGVRTPDSRLVASQTGAEVSALRADWFVANASVPPLYHEILELPRSVTELERDVGVSVARNLIEEKNVVRAGLRTSGVSQNNRVVERHFSSNGAYWRSYDFRNNLDSQNIFRNPLNLRPAGGEMIFNLPNGLQAYYLADGRGQRLDSAPVDIVSDRNNTDDPVIQNGRSCMSCHYGGIKEFRDDVRATLSNSDPRLFDLNKARALYPEQPVLDGLVAGDSSRFTTALSRLGVPVSQDALAEPITRVSRRFDNELTVADAASEAGIDARELQSRISASARLGAAGFNQLLTANGGIKRDAWERHFGDLVREFQLGEPLVSREFLARAEERWQEGSRRSGRDIALAVGLAALRARSPVAGTLLTGLASTTRNNAPIAANGGLNTPQSDALRFARTVFIMSRSGFFKPADLATALAKKSEWARTGLSITTDQSAADLIIQVDRTPFTTEFPYNVVDTRTGLVVCSGRVNSLFGTAAGKIASRFLDQIISLAQR
jgi:mono/diheme cytochrome c family protein